MLQALKISVIIPNYNYAQYIVETLESVRKQTYNNWECIIIDDGSTDNSREVIKEYLDHHDDYRFKLFNISNSGTSAAKNFGINISSGNYIQFLDADDLLENQKFARQIDAIINSKLKFVFSASRFFQVKNGQKFYFNKFPINYLAENSLEGYCLLEKLVSNNIFTISSPLFKRDFIPSERFVEELKNNEDWLFWLKIAFKEPSFTYVDNPDSMTLIRYHNESAMQNNRNMFLGEINVRNEIDKLIDLSVLINDTQKKKLKLLNLKLLSFHHIRSVDIGIGFNMISKYVFHKPLEAPILFCKAIIRLFKRMLKADYVKK